MRKAVANDRIELYRLIDKAIEKNGQDCDLNHIDVSRIDDFSDLFIEDFPDFKGDISRWDVSNATTMAHMFRDSNFNGDISQWNVSRVVDMCGMFKNSWFEGDLSRWDVSSVVDMESMFAHSQFNGDISQWNVSQVTNMESMFLESPFNKDISQWNVSQVTHMGSMFWESPFHGDISQWNTQSLRYATDMFVGNDQGLLEQKMSAWTAWLYLEHGTLPNEPYWKHLFEQVLPLVQTLDLDFRAQAQLVWSTHTGEAHKKTVGLPLPDLEH